ncbi:MAG: hypothetical protein V4603_17140, partial [Pseudomonadota bacterium]
DAALMGSMVRVSITQMHASNSLRGELA